MRVSGRNAHRSDAVVAYRPGDCSNRVHIQVIPGDVEITELRAVLPQSNVGGERVRCKIPAHRAGDLQIFRPLSVLEFEFVTVTLPDVAELTAAQSASGAVGDQEASERIPHGFKRGGGEPKLVGSGLITLQRLHRIKLVHESRKAGYGTD